MLTYMNLTKDNDDDDDADVDDADTRDIFKKRIIEGLVRKNECLKNEFKHEDDLRVVQMRETSKNKKLKHVTLKCSPRIRKVIKDNNDQLYFESQVYRVYDSYHVVICHHCQKMGHIWQANALIKTMVNPQSVESVRVHTKHENVMKWKRNVSIA